ncbi:MAG: hypothetical protein AAB513_03480 [Patescibacteria group bacterium]
MIDNIKAFFFHLRGEKWQIRWFFYWSAIILGYVLSQIGGGPDTSTKTAVQWFFWICFLMSIFHLYMVWSSGLYKEWLPFIGKKTRKGSRKTKFDPKPTSKKTVARGVEQVVPPASANDDGGNEDALDFTQIQK